MKTKLVRRVLTSVVASAMLSVPGTPVFGQDEPAGSGGEYEWEWSRFGFNREPAAIDVRSFGIVVSDMDRSVAFFQDVLGLDLVETVEVTDGSQLFPTDRLENKTLRIVRLSIPNEPYYVELLDYEGSDAVGALNNHNAPGSYFLNFGYLDPNAILDKLKSVGATKLNGDPITATELTWGPLWFRGPDGATFEIMGHGWDAQLKSLAGVDNVFRSHFGMTYTSDEQILSFYRDLLGFNLQGGFGNVSMDGLGIKPGRTRAPGDVNVANERVAAFIDVPVGAEYTAVEGYCAAARCEMFAFLSGARPPMDSQPEEAGTGYLEVVVTDIAAVLEQVTSSGLEIVYRNDCRSPGSCEMRAMVRDPAGFLVMLVEE